MANSNQIFRVDGNGCLVEVLNDMFDNEIVLFNFLKYDTNTNKKLFSIPFYIDFNTFFVLCDEVRFGRLENKALSELQKAKEQSSASGSRVYPKHIFELLRGTPAERSNRQDKKAESRVLRITPSYLDSAVVVFQVFRGPGEQTKEGLISPRFDFKNRNFEQIDVPFSSTNLRALFIKTNMMIQAYFTKQMINNVYVNQYKLDNSPVNSSSVAPNDAHAVHQKFGNTSTNSIPVIATNEKPISRTEEEKNSNKYNSRWTQINDLYPAV